MAGDWIKMRVDLADDPAVISIADCIELSEDDVVGKLHKLWSWADRHTTNGFAPGITARWVDKYVGKTGFAGAMATVGWLAIDSSGVTFPSFEKHNGKSAKSRAENTTRQRLSREQRDRGETGVARDSIPIAFRRHVLTRDKYRCVYCGSRSSEDQEDSRKAILSIDHITPATRGGRTAVDNLVSCCKLCNGEKSDRTPDEWGIYPSYLSSGVEFRDGFVIELSHKVRDKPVTREEKRRGENNKPTTSNKVRREDAPSDLVVGLEGWNSAESWCHAEETAKRLGLSEVPEYIHRIAALVTAKLVSATLVSGIAAEAGKSAVESPVGLFVTKLRGADKRIDVMAKAVEFTADYLRGPPEATDGADIVANLAQELSRKDSP